MNLHAVNLLFDAVKVVEGLTVISPSTSTPDYVSMKGYRKCAMLIQCRGHATLVSTSAITLLQATTVAAGNAKALAFTKMYSNVDTGAADALAAVAVTSNTFNATVAATKGAHYLIDIDVEQLDRANGFDCIRMVTADPTNAFVGFSVTYFLYGARYASSPPPSAILD